MNALTLKEWFVVIVVMLVSAVLAYIFGFHMLFLHNAYEVFWYALYFGGCLSLWQLLVSGYNFLSTPSETAKAKPKTA